MWEGAEGPQNKILLNKQTFQQPIKSVRNLNIQLPPLKRFLFLNRTLVRSWGEEEELEEGGWRERGGGKAGRTGR